MKLAEQRREAKRVKAEKLKIVMQILAEENARREKLRPKSGRLGKPLPVEDAKKEA